MRKPFIRGADDLVRDCLDLMRSDGRATHQLGDIQKDYIGPY